MRTSEKASLPRPEPQAASPPVVEVRALVKVFRDFWRRPRVRAVDGLDLTIRTGEVLGLLGPNGSGKSTTIKILLGLLFPSAGDVRIFGHSPRHVATRHRIGYLPEESYLHRQLTPRETLDFYGSLFGLPRRVRRDRTAQLLDMLGIAAAADRPVGSFSKGMARRVGLAQSLINAPRLLVWDEPTAGLDPLGCRLVKDMIRALARRGTTVLVTSHLLAEVEDVCDRVAILYNGRLQAEGPIAELLRAPDTLQVNLPASVPEADLRAALAGLRARLGVDPTITHPTLDLERYFLKVVAQAGGGAPAASPRLAPFLEEAPP